mmetsp:Transcript_107389/g.256560  ORF Transcript_107389/g.256560 Transcript_107389/m.256560 type:complete len:293 (-) Transcript_107389:532-1410(-)
MSLLLKLRKTLSHSAGNVRKGAVSREGVVQPLRKEPAVQRNLATVLCSHLREPLGEFAFQGEAAAEGLHRIEHRGRGGTGSSQRCLQLIHNLLARIRATHRVVFRGRQAVGVRHHVVGHDDTSLLIRLVQRPLLPQELCTLSELQGPLVKGWSVEVSQKNPTRSLLHRHQLPLQGLALLLLQSRETVRRDQQDGRHGLEMKEFGAFPCDLGSGLLEEFLHLLPPRIAPDVLMECLEIRSGQLQRRRLRSQDVAGHVVLHDLLGGARFQALVARVDAGCLVAHVQQQICFIPH